MIRMSSTRVLKMPPYFARSMAVRRGTSLPDCAAMAQVQPGSPAPVECACTRFFWIRAMLIGST